MIEISHEDLVQTMDYVMLRDGEAPGFENTLRIGKQFSDAGLTPIYLYDEEKGGLYVMTKERTEKKLN